jgi:RimJ/RimL family protein N-acetyltransferase
MSFLIGDKIRLRPFELADAPAVVEWFSRHEVRRTTRQYLPLSLQKEEALLKQPDTDRDMRLAIIAREDERLVGACGLHRIDIRARHSEIGLVIGDPADWGRGFGSEAMRLVIGYGFRELNLNRIWLEVHEDNPAAIHLYEKLGFRREGTLRQHAFREGRYLDCHVMSVLAVEWPR